MESKHKFECVEEARSCLEKQLLNVHQTDRKAHSDQSAAPLTAVVQSTVQSAQIELPASTIVSDSREARVR